MNSGNNETEESIKGSVVDSELDTSVVDIRDKAEEAFDNYAKELLLERAFPDYRDGLTPVQRRTIFGMYKMGLSYKNNKPARQVKSARIVGDVMGKYHPHSDCCFKNTLVYMASGKPRRIDDLYLETLEDPNKTFEVYSIDDEGKLVRSEISHVRIGQYTDEIYEVKLSNGYVIKTTSNHPFLTYNNEWVKAEDLKEGTPLANVRLTDKDGYPYMRSFNKLNKNTVRLLGLIKEIMLEKDATAYSRMNLHHINENKYDNRESNLEFLTDSEHMKVHTRNSTVYIETLNRGRETMFSGENTEMRERIRIKNSIMMKAYNQKQYLNKEFQIIEILKENGLEVTNESYNEYRTSIYNGTSIKRLKERGDIVESVSELVGKNLELDGIEDAVGLTKDLYEHPKERGKPKKVLRYTTYYQVVDAIMGLVETGKEITTDNVREERVNQLTHKYNKKKLKDIPNIQDYLGEFNYEGIIYVDSIKVTKVDKEPMYDFTVNEYENALFVASEDEKSFIVLHNSGLYGAMTKMAKDWVFGYPLIELIGNVGSSDGDNPASMRYTLARLSNTAGYLTDGLNKKNVVDWQLTYEDTDYEPTYLPAQYPNLLVSGSVGGIAIGYVVDILPHNLAEVLEVSIQDAKGEELSPIAPDFPTGGVIVNGNELEEMYNTGMGKVIVRGRYRVETDKKKRRNKRSIVFYDVPYGVQKSKCVDKIQELIANNGMSGKQQLVGAVKAQDESGSEGLRITVNVTDDADIDVVTELIYKHTLLEKSQRYEFLTILNGQPRRMSLKRYITEFNEFRRATIIRELESDNEVINSKVVRLDALIKLDGIRDEVILCIRNSANKQQARDNLVSEFEYTSEQADYLLSLQLSRLTKDNYDKYRSDRDELLKIRDRNSAILASPEKVNELMIKGYQELITELGKPRQTKVLSQVREVNLTLEKVVPLEDVIIGVTPDGTIKRSSTRSYSATQAVDFDVYELEATTHEEVLVFTDLGQVGVIQVKDIPEMRWGDKGEQLMTYAKNYHLEERVIGLAVKDSVQNIIFITNDNRVKVMAPSELAFKTTNTFYSILPIEREKDERVVGIAEVTDNTTIVVTATNKRKTIHYGLAFKAGEVAPSGRNAKGRKMASISQSKILDKVYLSGELDEQEYREVGKAPVKDVFPVDYTVNATSRFVSDTMNTTTKPEEPIGTEEEVEHAEHVESNIEYEEHVEHVEYADQQSEFPVNVKSDK